MQNAMAFIIVFLAAIYAGWKFLPARLRVSLAGRSAAWMQRTGRISAENARRFESKLATGGACGSCDSCKACATSPKENRDAAFAVIPIYKAE